MAALDLVDLVPGELRRVVVVAAHPDDESLGAGGLLATLGHRGSRVQVDVVLLTAGELSHPESPTHTPDALAVRRRQEAAVAVRLLAPAARLHWAGTADGAVAQHEPALVARLVELVGDGEDALIVAPWRHDGHPDHEAAGRVASAAARRTGAGLLEYPIWAWHWSRPADAPWASMRRLSLDAGTTRTKAAAIAAHATQTRPLSDHPGDEVLLAPQLLEHFLGSEELFVAQAPDDDALERVHAEHADPWGVDERWYERRKRALTLAMLPRERHGRTLELGCSTGALAADLATRCESVLAVDASATATRAARRRIDVAGLAARVEVEQRSVPEDWPDGSFDLVVVSELGYYLSPRDLRTLVRRIDGALAEDAVVLLCHYRHQVEGWPLDGPDVHDLVVRDSPWTVRARHVEDDVELLLMVRRTR